MTRQQAYDGVRTLLADSRYNNLTIDKNIPDVIADRASIIVKDQSGNSVAKLEFLPPQDGRAGGVVYTNPRSKDYENLGIDANSYVAVDQSGGSSQGKVSFYSGGGGVVQSGNVQAQLPPTSTVVYPDGTAYFYRGNTLYLRLSLRVYGRSFG